MANAAYAESGTGAAVLKEKLSESLSASYEIQMSKMNDDAQVAECLSDSVTCSSSFFVDIASTSGGASQSHNKQTYLCACIQCKESSETQSDYMQFQGERERVWAGKEERDRESERRDRGREAEGGMRERERERISERQTLLKGLLLCRQVISSQRAC